MAFNSPLSYNSFFSCHNTIEICLISEICRFLFDTRVASVILHLNTELAEVVLEMHHVSPALSVMLWYE